MTKHNEILLKAFEDTMDLLTKREQEEYNQLNREQDHMRIQALDDDAEAIENFLELMR